MATKIPPREERRQKLRDLLPDNMKDLPLVEYRFRPAQTPAEAASDIAFVESYRELTERVESLSMRKQTKPRLKSR